MLTSTLLGATSPDPHVEQDVPSPLQLVHAVLQGELVQVEPLGKLHQVLHFLPVAGWGLVKENIETSHY